MPGRVLSRPTRLAGRIVRLAKELHRECILSSMSWTILPQKYATSQHRRGLLWHDLCASIPHDASGTSLSTMDHKNYFLSWSSAHLRFFFFFQPGTLLFNHKMIKGYDPAETDTSLPTSCVWISSEWTKRILSKSGSRARCIATTRCEQSIQSPFQETATTTTTTANTTSWRTTRGKIKKN